MLNMFLKQEKFQILLTDKKEVTKVVAGFLGGPKKTPTFRIGHNTRTTHCSSRPSISKLRFSSELKGKTTEMG
jgi:hypothetical protein